MVIYSTPTTISANN